MARINLIREYRNEYITLRIIPHHTVLNSASRNLQRAIYELLSVKSRSFNLSRDNGIHIAINPAPDIWWITKMDSIDDDSKRIEFYVAIPVEFADAFRTKFRNHEQWRKCTLEVVANDTITLPTDEHTDLYGLKYVRHDMFSLNFDYSQHNTPMRDILGVTNELKSGESVNLFIRCEPISRGKWKRIVDFAWEQWERGKVPTPSGFNPFRLMRDLLQMGVNLTYEVKSLIDDILNGIERSFFTKDGADKPKKERANIHDPERAELLVNGDLSDRTKKKRNLPAFRTSIRYAVRSIDPIRRDMLARSVANAYGDLNGDNRLEAIKISYHAKQELNDLSAYKSRDRRPMIISTDEIGKLAQLPTAELQAEYKEALESNQRVEIELPSVFLDDSGILAGTATDRGTVYNVYIPTKDRDILFTPRIVNGSPRMGKDQAVINMIVEAKRKHGIGAVIPDVVNERNGHRGMADAIRDHLPADDIVDIDLGDTKNPVYLGLESIVRNIPDMRIAADRISEEIAQFLLADGDEDKVQTADYLREAAKVTNGDILGIKLMFLSEEYRRQKIEEYADIFDMDIWRDYDRLKEGRQGQLFAPIMRRIGQIMNSEFLKPIFCQAPNPEMDLYRWIDEGKVVIFRVPTGQLSERVVQTLMYWITLNVFLIKVTQGGRSKTAGTFLVLNEPHQFLSDGLVHFMERMLSEGPKYRLAPVIIFHHFAQFKKYPGFVDMMMAASANWHIFKNTNDKVYDRLMPYLSRTFSSAQHAFESTKRFQYIGVWLNANGEYEPPFICDALPMVGSRYDSVDNSFITRRHSQMYGRPIAKVLADIRGRNRMVFAGNMAENE